MLATSTISTTTKTTSRALAVAAAMLLALVLSMSLGAGRAYAGAVWFDVKEIDGKTVGLSYDPHDDWWSKYAFEAKKKVTNVKSSNPKVASVTFKGNNFFSIHAKKAGKTKITYKIGGRSHKATIIVKKYANPFKAISVGGKSCLKGFKRECVSSTKSLDYYGHITGKVKVVPAKNWKVKAINAYNGATPTKIKNGAKVPEGTSTVQVMMVNKKTKVWQRTYIYADAG